MALKIYKKNLDYSYTLGIHPTIELLVQKPYLAKTVLIANKSRDVPEIKKIKELCKINKINYDIADNAINKIALKDKTQVIGVFNKYKSGIESGKNHLVLVNPTNPGNIGTIIRSAIGFNFTNIAIIRPAVDIFEPNLIRSTMGALFKINFEYFDSFQEYNENYKDNKIYPFVLNAKNNLTEVNFETPCTLVFGNEGKGLPKEFEKYDTSIKIPHSKDIESLNLSVSASIGMFFVGK